MSVKLYRRFIGGYEPDPAILLAKKVIVQRPTNRRVMLLTSVNHGFGQIKGTTKKLGKGYAPVPVCVFRRDNRLLLWETTSKPDGTYKFRNIAKDLECFIVAFDPNKEYNAVIQDKVIAK